jgi:DNA-binding CsgD family transcriptional regulator/tetratricopeptide (TPR) repeat protein
VELVERSGLLAGLDALLAEVASGMGRIALVGGEPGVGKTALVRTFTGSHADVRLLWGNCEPLVVAEPLGPFHDMVPLQTVIGARPGRVALLQAILRELGARGAKPTIMVLEDVHWADDATLDALRFLGRRVHDTAGLIVATFREDESSTSGLRPVLGDLATAPGHRRWRVEPLTEQGVATLATDSALDAGRLHAVTGGNPFFVTEVLAAPGWTLPPTVRDAVLARIARLDAAGRALIEAVSVAPGGLEPQLAVLLSGATAAAVDAAIDLGEIVLASDRLLFRHELARLAVESSMSASRRRRLQQELLALLEDTPGIDASRIVHHADAAGDADAVLRHAPRAAREAAAQGAHRAAAEHLRRAVEASDGRLPAGERAGLLSAWASELRVFEAPEIDLPIRRRALELWRRASDSLGEARELLQMSRLMEALSDRAEGARLLGDATAILEPLSPGPDLAEAYAGAAYVAATDLRFEEALDRAAAAIELAEATGASEAASLALAVRGTVLNLRGSGLDGVPEYERIRALASLEGDRESEMVAVFSIGGDLAHHRRYAEARAYLREAIEIGRAADLDYRVTNAELTKARIDFEQGRWAEALQILDGVPALATRTPVSTAEILTIRGRIGTRAGAPGAAADLDRAWDIVSGGGAAMAWDLAAGRAESAWLQGRAEWIPERIGDLYPRVRDADVRWPTGELALWLWRAGALDEPPVNAAEPFLLQMAGDWRGAADAWARYGCPYEYADALADGDEPALRESLTTFVRLGATPAADRVRSRMRTLGVARVPAGPRRSTRSAPAQLTARQLEILGLLAEGLSDREIAARLFITPKTAGHHVSAVLAKLDVRSRTEAALAARRMGIDGT